MQTKAKVNSVVTHALEKDGRVIVFKVLGAGVLNEETGAYADVEWRLDRDRASSQNVERAEVNGWVQRCVDSAAIKRENPDGTIRKPREMAVLKSEEIGKIVEHYNSGTENWSPARVDSGAVMDPIILAAIAEVTGLSISQVRERTPSEAEKRGVTPKQYLDAIAVRPQIAPVVARIRAGKSGIKDDDDLLDGLVASVE